MLSAVLLVLALFFSPAMRMNGTAAHASETHAASAMSGHCADPEPDSDDQKSRMSASCITACAALHPMPVTIAADLRHKPASVQADTVPSALRGIFTEFDTPPPRPAA